MSQIRNLGVAFFLLAAALSHAECPPWLKDDTLVPPCPTHGFLGDEFPALAHVLSERALDPKSPEGALEQSRIVETARKILAYSGKRPPLLFLNVDKATFDAVKKSILKLAGAESASKKRLLATLRWIPTKKVSPNTWVQDTFQTFNDPATGRATLRQISDYRNHDTDETAKLLKAMEKECPELTVGKGLRTYADHSCRGGECGGNIEFIPHAGICLRGDSQKSGYAREYCAPKDETVVPSKWLKVGHIDEYVATHPLPGSTCGVVLSIASYQKAVALLETNTKAPLFQNDFPRAATLQMGGDSAPLLQFRNEQLTDGPQPLQAFCRAFTKPEKPEDSSETFHPAEHEIPSSGRSKTAAKPKRCTNATNGDLLEYLRSKASGSPSLHERNLELDKIFQEAAKTIKTKLQERLGSKCPVETIELPQIFSDKERALSLFPNPSNSIYVEGNLLIPDPVNPAMKEAIEKAYSKVGLKPSFLSTFDTLHAREGNLHCASQTMRYCRGTGKPTTPHEPGPPETADDVPFDLPLKEPAEIERALSGKPGSQGIALTKLDEALERESAPHSLATRLAPKVEGLIAKGSPEIQKLAFRILGRFSGVGTPILEKWLANGNSENRIALFRGLSDIAELEPHDLAPLVRQGLKDKDPAVVRQALMLSKQARLSRGELTSITRHPEPTVRRLAYRRLMESFPLTEALAERALQDTDEETRSEMAFRLSEIKDSAAAKRLITAAIAADDPSVRAAGYASALRAYANPQKFLAQALDDKSDDVGRIALYHATDRIGGPLAITATAKALAHRNPEHQKNGLEFFFRKGTYWTEEYAQVFKATSPSGKLYLLNHTDEPHFDSLTVGLLSEDKTLRLAALAQARLLNQEHKARFEFKYRPAVTKAARDSGLSLGEATALAKRLCHDDEIE